LNGLSLHPKIRMTSLFIYSFIFTKSFDGFVFDGF